MRQLVDWTDVRLLVKGTGASLHLNFLMQCKNSRNSDIIKGVGMMSGKLNIDKESLDVLGELKNIASDNASMNAISK